jgi:hypothetical protein
VVAGVGNRGQRFNNVGAPASIPGVVAVSGVDQNGDFWPSSASGPQTVVAAPASRMSVIDVPSDFASGYARGDGTSFATAIVSGVVALIRAKYPRLNAANVINRLIRTAKDNGDPGRDRYFGFSTIQPLAALTADVPLVTANALGAPPVATPAASSLDAAVPPPALHSDRRWPPILLVLVPVGMLLGLLKVFLLVRRRRPVRPVAGYAPGRPGEPRLTATRQPDNRFTARHSSLAVARVTGIAAATAARPVPWRGCRPGKPAVTRRRGLAAPVAALAGVSETESF